MRFLTVYITAKDKKEAEKLSKILLEERLVACCNIVAAVKSLYWWNGKITSSKEALLLAKTTAGKEGEIIDLVKKHHSYKTPCINFLPIGKGNPDYLAWIRGEVKNKHL